MLAIGVLLLPLLVVGVTPVVVARAGTSSNRWALLQGFAETPSVLPRLTTLEQVSTAYALPAAAASSAPSAADDTFSQLLESGPVIALLLLLLLILPGAVRKPNRTTSPADAAATAPFLCSPSSHRSTSLAH